MQKIIILSIFGLAAIYLLYKFYFSTRILLYKVKKAREKMLEHRQSIDDISNNGFTIYTKNIPRKISWKEITSIQFLSSDSLDVSLKDQSKINIQSSCLGWHEFIKNVPKGINGFDHEYVENFFASLAPCNVCGCYAIENGECLNCDHSAEMEKKYKGEDSLENFYKTEQLDYFTVHFDNDESVDATLRKAKQNEVFKVNDKWVIYPTKEEIQKERDEMK